MAGVAVESGLSRAYVYRFFPDKNSLVSAALVRRDEAFWSDAHDRISAAPDIAGMVAEAVLLSRAAPLGPLALELAEAEPEAYVQAMGSFVNEMVPGLSDFWVAELAAAQQRGSVRADIDVEDAAEWVIRVLVSLVGTPGRRLDADDPESLRRHLRMFLSPALAPA